MSYTTPQEGKEDIAPQAPPPLLPGVRYSSFPIIAACLQVRVGCYEVLSRVYVDTSISDGLVHYCQHCQYCQHSQHRDNVNIVNIVRLILTI